MVVLALVTGFLWEGRAIQLSRMSSEPETDIASLGPSFGPSTAVGPGGKTGFLDGRLAGIDVDALEWVKLTSSEWSFLHDPTRALAQLHTIHEYRLLTDLATTVHHSVCTEQPQLSTQSPPVAPLSATQPPVPPVTPAVPTAAKYHCVPGQGESAMALMGDKELVGNRACAALCSTVPDCLGFDVPRGSKKGCRLYSKNKPRFGVPGSDDREYCTFRTPRSPPPPAAAPPAPPTEPQSAASCCAFTFWANDFHISTIGNVKSQIPSATFIDKSLSGACVQTDTCAKNLRVLNSGNGINPSMDVKRRFVDTYRNDAEMNRADAVLCFHPSAMCELFMELRPQKFVIASTRYEMGRHSPSAWTLWNENLKKIAADPRNIVAANNKYDAEYIKYFTGLDPVIIPSTIDMPDRYAPAKKTFLLATVHGKHAGQLTQQVARQFPTVLPMKTAYPGLYEYHDLCKHLGIVHLPYQTSIMSLFEQYAMVRSSKYPV